MKTSSQTTEPEESAYERRDVDIVAMALLVVSFIACGVVVHIAVASIVSGLKSREEESWRSRAHGLKTAQFPEPQLQQEPAADLQKLREREEALLSSAGWVDQKAKVVHMPIARAIDLLVERGLPKTTQSVTPVELQQKRADPVSSAGRSSTGASTK